MAYHTNTNNKKTMLDKLTSDKETQKSGVLPEIRRILPNGTEDSSSGGFNNPRCNFYKIVHPKVVEYRLFSCKHGPLNGIDQILSHKTSYIKLRIEIIDGMFS